MNYREAYETWLKEFAADQATVDELKAIAGDEKEIEDRFYTELSFGTAGMRGVLGAGTNRMNLYNVRRATKGFADYINGKSEEDRKRGVVIAYDSRRMSPEFAKAAALVLCHEGIHVYLFDELRPVPILSYAVRHLHGKARRKRIAHAVHQPCARRNKTDGSRSVRPEPADHRRVDVLHGDCCDLREDCRQAQPPDLPQLWLDRLKTGSIHVYSIKKRYLKASSIAFRLWIVSGGSPRGFFPPLPRG